MNLDHYEFRASASFLEYEFDSKGPKGVIKKIIKYQPFDIHYYNLVLGDVNPATGEIDDHVVSDNKDRDKVLATVAATAMAFLRRFPTARIYAEGSTKSRTRLYQIGIASNWKIISLFLEVLGRYKRKWQRFEKNINYEAFLVMRKKDVTL